MFKVIFGEIGFSSILLTSSDPRSCCDLFMFGMMTVSPPSTVATYGATVSPHNSERVGQWITTDVTMDIEELVTVATLLLCLWLPGLGDSTFYNEGRI